MHVIRRRFPRLSVPLLVDLAKLIVRERNAAAVINQVYKDCRLSLAILGCQVVRNAVARLDPAAGIRFLAGPGLSYVVDLGEGVVLRVQPDIPEIRDVLPAEEAVLRRFVQTTLFPEDAASGAVLRLQVSQEPGSPVDAISLLLVDPAQGTTLDHVTIYDGTDYLDTKAFELPPEDPDTDDAFEFDPANDADDAANEDD